MRYPKNILFRFENKSTAVHFSCTATMRMCSVLLLWVLILVRCIIWHLTGWVSDCTPNQSMNPSNKSGYVDGRGRTFPPASPVGSIMLASTNRLWNVTTFADRPLFWSGRSSVRSSSRTPKTVLKLSWNDLRISGIENYPSDSTTWMRSKSGAMLIISTLEVDIPTTIYLWSYLPSWTLLLFVVSRAVSSFSKPRHRIIHPKSCLLFSSKNIFTGAKLSQLIPSIQFSFENKITVHSLVLHPHTLLYSPIREPRPVNRTSLRNTNIYSMLWP